MPKSKQNKKSPKHKGTLPAELVDLTPDEIKRLPKPREGFDAHVATLLAMYRGEPELQIKGFDASAIEASFTAYQALRPLEDSARKHLEVVQETRLLNSSKAWSGILAIYNRAQNVARTNRDVARGIADFSKFMALGPRKKKQAPPAAT